MAAVPVHSLGRSGLPDNNSPNTPFNFAPKSLRAVTTPPHTDGLIPHPIGGNNLDVCGEVSLTPNIRGFYDPSTKMHFTLRTKRSNETDHLKSHGKPSTSSASFKYPGEVEARSDGTLRRGRDEDDSQYRKRVLNSVKIKPIEKYRSGEKPKVA